MTAAYKITLLASGLLLLVVVGSLLWQGDPPSTAGEDVQASAETEADANPSSANEGPGESTDNPLPDLYTQRSVGERAEDSGSAASPPPTRIHYSDDPLEPLPAPTEAAYPSLDVGRPPFAARESIFADDYEPLPAEPVEVTAAAVLENSEAAEDPVADANASDASAAATPAPSAAATPPTPPAATAAASVADARTALGPVDQPARPSAIGGPAADASARPAGGPTGAGNPRMYTIETGDSLSSVALAIYGSATKWVDIAQANPLIDPNRLKVGQQIRLPDLGSATAAADPARDPDDLPRRGASYTVQSGDTLSSVAKQFYNSASKWELIYQANRQTIGSDPGNVRVGMELLIPPPANGAN